MHLGIGANVQLCLSDKLHNIMSYPGNSQTVISFNATLSGK